MKRILIIAICVCIVFTVVMTWFEKSRTLQNIAEKTIISGKSTKEKFIPTLPNLQTIFSDDHTWTATLSAEHIRTVLVTGDIIPARSVNVGVANRNNPLWPYEKVAEPIRQLHPDITFANLETPLLHNCPPTVEGMIFCGSDRNVQGLKTIGVTVASLANNHAGNHNVNGVLETISHLQENGIAVTGINGAYVKNIRGVKFAFLGYNDISTPQPGISNADEKKIIQDIVDAKKIADIVIVMYHWGVEYRAQPDDRQMYLAHFTVDHGADLVLSNHPHWIQPVEIYKNKYIMYAHGNFIFDQMWSEETKKGVLGFYTFYDDQLIDAQYIPLYISDYGQARFVDGKEKKEILANLRKQSLLLEKNSTISNDEFLMSNQ